MLSFEVISIVLSHLFYKIMCPRSFIFVCFSQKRQVLEEAELLDTRISALEEDLDEVETSDEEDEEEEKVKLNSQCLTIYPSKNYYY